MYSGNALKYLLVCAVLSSCGVGDGPSGPRDIVRRSEVVYEEDAGLEGAVRIDSLEWLPFLPFPGPGGITEVEGVFAAIFRNTSADSVRVRYDLRFFDDEECLVDAFIPFGQPVDLAAGEKRRVQGEFLLRADDARQAAHIELLRLVVRVRRVE